MKISRILKQQIYQVVKEQLNAHMQIVDAEFRADRISHESWKSIHISACAVLVGLPGAISTSIEGYRK